MALENFSEFREHFGETDLFELFEHEHSIEIDQYYGRTCERPAGDLPIVAPEFTLSRTDRLSSFFSSCSDVERLLPNIETCPYLGHHVETVMRRMTLSVTQSIDLRAHPPGIAKLRYWIDHSMTSSSFKPTSICARIFWRWFRTILPVNLPATRISWYDSLRLLSAVSMCFIDSISFAAHNNASKEAIAWNRHADVQIKIWQIGDPMYYTEYCGPLQNIKGVKDRLYDKDLLTMDHFTWRSVVNRLNVKVLDVLQIEYVHLLAEFYDLMADVNPALTDIMINCNIASSRGLRFHFDILPPMLFVFLDESDEAVTNYPRAVQLHRERLFNIKQTAIGCRLDKPLIAAFSTPCSARKTARRLQHAQKSISKVVSLADLAQTLKAWVAAS